MAGTARVAPWRTAAASARSHRAIEARRRRRAQHGPLKLPRHEAAKTTLRAAEAAALSRIYNFMSKHDRRGSRALRPRGEC